MGKPSQRSVRHRGIGRGLAAALGVVVLAAALPACESVNESLGVGKKAPDEFVVYRSAPLTRPPDFQLRPPRPGAARPNEAAPREQARTVLLSEAGASADSEGAAVTQGESAFLQQAGAAGVSPEIRRIVDREFAGYASEDESFVESLMFWQDDEQRDQVVDPAAESRRLRRNAARGAAVTEGATPTIKRREKALLEDLFN